MSTQNLFLQHINPAQIIIIVKNDQEANTLKSAEKQEASRLRRQQDTEITQHHRLAETLEN